MGSMRKSLACLLAVCMLASLLSGCQLFEARQNEIGNSAGNINNGGEAVIQGEWIYYSSWSDNRNLYKINLDGSGLQKIYDVKDSGTVGFYSLNAVGDWIYYSDSRGYNIHAVKTDGSEHKIIAENLEQNFYVAGDSIYYISGEIIPSEVEEGEDSGDPNYDYGIYTVQTDGSGSRRITHCDYDQMFCISGEWIYYTDSTNIHAVKTDGSEDHRINEDNSQYINVVDGWIYYSNLDDNGKIYAIRTDGTGRRKINDDEYSFYINVVGDWIYYCFITEWGVPRGNIYAIKTDGSECHSVNSDMSFEIKVVGDWIYYHIWNDTYRIKTDGSERQQV